VVETTSIYSVSIAKLRAVCGGGDLTMVESATASLASFRPLPTDYRLGPRVFVSWKSEITLNERAITKNELVEALLDPKWRGTMLYEKIEDPPKGCEPQGEFKEIGSFAAFLNGQLSDKCLERGISMRGHFCGLSSASRTDYLQDEKEMAESLEQRIQDEEFVKDLLNGKRRFKNRGRDYARALEGICNEIGTCHGVLGTDRLRSLEIKTPLIKIGSPIRLPKIEDTPAICYLDELELESEIIRLRKFRFSSDPGLFLMQKKYQGIIEHSLENERGLVTFYY
jgi:hypothetical protein